MIHVGALATDCSDAQPATVDMEEAVKRLEEANRRHTEVCRFVRGLFSSFEIWMGLPFPSRSQSRLDEQQHGADQAAPFIHEISYQSDSGCTSKTIPITAGMTGAEVRPIL